MSGDKEHEGGKPMQDRSVHVGHGQNVQVVSGDGATVRSDFHGQQQITIQDFRTTLVHLKEVLDRAEVGPGKRQAIDEAVAEAQAEAAKPEPDKGKIAGALQQAVTLAKFANNAKELAEQAAPVVREAVKWLGVVGTVLGGIW